MRRLSNVLIRKRVMIMLFALMGVASFLTFRLGYLQIWKNTFFQEKALQQRVQAIPVAGRRGAIYDRNGIPLAISVNATSVYAIPAEVRNKEDTAHQVAEILDLDYEFVLTRLEKRSASEWLKKKTTMEETEAIVAANLQGIGVVENSERFYPYGSIAPQTLGFVGIDNQGLEGLELYYDKHLRGEFGQTIFERDAVGRIIEDGIRGYESGKPGGDLVLTLDYYVQQIAQREVKRATQETGSRLGLIIITDPKTGEIIANAIYPTYDIENFSDYPVDNRRNIAVTDTYEPGSTFKGVTMAIALEEEVANINTGFFDPGFINVSGWTVRCWNRGGHGSQSFFETLQNSCNPFYAKLGIDLGGELFYPGLINFNFGHRMGVDFPGEAPGTVRPPSSNIPLVTWANIGFGQGLTVTPMQMIASFGAIANDGMFSVPHYVRELIVGDEAYPPDVPEPRQIISTANANIVKDALRSVITTGTAKRADAPGYPVAGKTGTAQVAEDGRYSHSKMITSFAGYSPADDPQMAGLLVLWEPQGAFFGGIIAAPVFGRLTEQVMPTLGVERRDDPSARTERTQIVVPDVISLEPFEAEQIIQQIGLRVEFVGEGKQIVGQVPAAHAEVEPGTLIYVYTDVDYLDVSTEIPNPFGV